MELFIAAVIFVGLSIFGMCFNIIFRKNGKFPETEVSRNKEMRKLGITCAKDEEMKLWGRKGSRKNLSCEDLGCADCAGCDIVPNHKKQKVNP